MQFTTAPTNVNAIVQNALNVSVTNTPTVDATGSGVAITNTPNVGVPAAGTTLQPTGMPTFVGRNVDAQAAASLTMGGAVTSTLIAQPGANKAIELHAGNVSIACVGPAGSAGGVTVTLQRSDTSAVIWAATVDVQASPAAVNVQIPFDFQGATLPFNVGLNMSLSFSGGGASSVSVTTNINYSVVQ